jgi:ORF6N domain
MLNTDLAALYRVPTYRLNEAVKRNRERFPGDFMFQLTSEEAVTLHIHLAPAYAGRHGRYGLPLAFTELGIAMLASVLKSERAVRANIELLREFARTIPKRGPGRATIDGLTIARAETA